MWSLFCNHKWKIISVATKEVKIKNLDLGESSSKHTTYVLSKCTICGTLSEKKLNGVYSTMNLEDEK